MLGIGAEAVTVECRTDGGLPRTTIVGLPESAVREARDRVKGAIISCGFAYPGGKVVVNLAPGHISKSGTSLDLPIALSVLSATGQLDTRQLGNYEFIGELGLFGELRRVRGALTFALAASNAGRRLIVPADNEAEAGLAPAGSLYLAQDLLEVTRFLSDPMGARLSAPSAPCLGPIDAASRLDSVIGQETAKRALTLAAAGGHHLLMVGPPGTGKTMLARSLAELLPRLDERGRVEVAAVYSAAGIDRPDYTVVPFRDPHHSATAPALVGGGNPPQPGEIALAHHGVLFLDELPHFKPSVLNHLREPIESGTVVITRANYKVPYPCKFQLIAAMNPCPAGRVCREDACRCDQTQVKRYQSRISGPLLDRIDLHVHVREISDKVLAGLKKQTSKPGDAEERRCLVQAARTRQAARQACCNADLDPDAVGEEIARAGLAKPFIAAAVSKYRLSARSYHKVWRVARTIADLEGSEVVAQRHFAEALSYRAMNWESGVV